MFPAGRSDVATRAVDLAGGITLRVAESGNRDSPVILLLHGWGASIYMWRDWFAPLAAAGYRAIAIDLPGHGLSEKPDGVEWYTLSGMVGAVRQFLDVDEIVHADVVAQSMAGTIVLSLAQSDARLGRMALVNPACFGRIRFQPFFRLARPPLLDRVLPRLVARWIVARAHRLVYGDASRLTARDDDEYWAPSQFPAYARAMRRLLNAFDWRRANPDAMAANLRALASRLLVILGTRDRLVLDSLPYARALRERLPAMRLYEIEGGGHAVNEERPEDVVPLVLSFFEVLS